MANQGLKNIIKTSGPLSIASGTLSVAFPELFPGWLLMAIFWFFVVAAIVLALSVFFLIIQPRRDISQ